MFLTVTFNPALDKTLVVESNPPGETVRAIQTVDLAGGKGINVARALRALGAPVRALAPLGGFPGAHAAELARQEGIELLALPIAGRTRTALTIRDRQSGMYWHYLEPGPELTEAELTALKESFEHALESCHSVALSGSLPCASMAPVVCWMVRTASEAGRRVALDSFGPMHAGAMEAGPWLAKPNVEEWAAATGDTLRTEADRWAALERMAEWGVRLPVLSMGPDGALALVDTVRYWVIPPRADPVNDLGGGDSMVAGILWAAHAGYSLIECLAWGAACGAANAAVWDPGAIDLATVTRLVGEVRVHREE